MTAETIPRAPPAIIPAKRTCFLFMVSPSSTISPMDRWALNDQELASGTGLQVLVGPYWIDVSIEHNGSEYYGCPLLSDYILDSRQESKKKWSYWVARLKNQPRLF